MPGAEVFAYLGAALAAAADAPAIITLDGTRTYQVDLDTGALTATGQQ